MPLPFKGPDQTLFQLLGFVVAAGQRFATITDLKVGDGNQEAAVGTTIAMLEQGTRVMSAVHKRMHYAMRQEFKLLVRIMADYLPPQYPYTIANADQSIMASDFDDRVDVLPVSNPNIFSQAQRIALAQTEMQLAAQAPQMHNMYEVYRRMYEALGVRDIDKVLHIPPSRHPKPEDPAEENIKTLQLESLVAFTGQNHEAHIMAHLVFGSSPTVASTPQIAIELQKHVMEHVKIQAEEQAQAAVMQQMQGQQMQGDPSVQIEGIKAQFIAEGMQRVKELSAQVGLIGQPQQPDPLIDLKKQELQMKQAKDQGDMSLDQAELQLDQQKEVRKGEEFQDRIQSQEKQTFARIDAAAEREKMRNAQQRG
jgi:hypothetical protein